jgi:hypothetical protein
MHDRHIEHPVLNTDLRNGILRHRSTMIFSKKLSDNLPLI